ncbi:PHD finger protein 20 [Colletotrichum chrysophilum]|uniref:PHD finger protein 20 n=1 Tax=Colletotrichum chrysophilum TaxID=1836956 RepID=A0AAD9EBS6_9PEZI|nr:PHD finger protein 20 [Colletotrichum chrysophilum]
MSGDQLASRQDFYLPIHPSFGNPNAQPPTPKQTPTSAVFPSPVFETPKQRQGHFDDAGGWTPRFAEEYSVFNTTPGNLRGSQTPFAEFSSASTSYPPSTGLKRPLSAESLAAQIASHANHLSPNPSLPLPPVDISQRLNSSHKTSTEQQHGIPSQKDGPASLNPASQGAPKQAGDREGAADLNGQTATPPPSSHKGGRKLAPKLRADNMQNDHGYGQPDFSGTPQQNMAAAFVAATDMFGYPMSAPATAPNSFWDPGADMSAMDIDFSFGPNVFQPTHRHMPSFDASQMFQETTPLPPANSQENTQPVKRSRPLAPKPPASNVQSSSADISMASFTTSAEDPFGIVSPGAGVDPGLLFSRPSSSNTETNIPVTQGSAQYALAAAAETQSRAPMHGGDIRRSLSSRELAPSRMPDHMLGSSPSKSQGRPNGLQRSVSENRGRRKALPTLAPAIQPRPVVNNGPAAGPSRPLSRPSGRISPLKQQHSRLSSLTSIPESSPRTRTSVKFTIDSKGRARAETTVVVDDAGSNGAQRKPVTREMPRREKSWDSEDDDSSTDDEPIIIPSRNTSFALPDPRKPTSSSMFHSSRRSVSEHSSSSHGASTSQHDAESEAETVMNDNHGKGGDAASELRKLIESRQKRGPQVLGSQRSNRFASGSFVGNFQGGLMSPGALTEASLPSPTKATYSVRCVCRNNANRPGEYMVQCESCEMWLHGPCINISRRTLPSVYICAFCSNTPNMRGGRHRGNGPLLGPSGASPLKHKSFR